MPRDATFQPNPDDRWPLTPRTRYYVWTALVITVDELADDLTRMLAHRSTDLDATMKIQMFPPGVIDQSVEWWVQLLRSGDRLTNALALGESMVPRTPGEEAILYVALTHEVMVLRDMHHEMFGDDQTFKKLPKHRKDDYDFHNVLGELAGDTDIEAIFDRSRDGIGDPDDATNRMLGMGDYRLSAWHQTFDAGHWSDDWSEAGPQ